MKHFCEISVRSYECDQYGHVNNANYLNYLEYARCEFLKDIGFPYFEAVQKGYGIYVAKIEIEYKSPAFPDDKLCIETESSKLGAVSGTLSQAIMRDTQTIALARVSWAFVDAKGSPTRIPAEYNVAGLRPSSDKLVKE
jgi:acyl-CoA thioester hydrolase